MVAKEQCPDTQELQRHLLGEIPEPHASALDRHLEQCPQCLRAMDQPSMRDTMTDAIRTQGETTDQPEEATIRGLIERINNLPGPGPSGEAPTSDATLGLPSPSEEASAPAVTIPGYDVLSELGRGGMGVVYQARHRGLNRLVALKMILAGEHAGSVALARFKAEAEAVASLQHPNIVQVHEVGECDGRPFFSLEFVDGGSLAQKLDGTPLLPRDAARLIETLARAMDYAHQRRIIHRDLKPGNILLTKDGTPKIADFGLAKHLAGAPGASATGGLTQTDAIVGTPSYMAPEQASGQGREVGPEADVYALGALLYELLTGRPPFKAATPLETVLQVAADDPVLPTRLQPRTPRDLETICLKCLQKTPAKRYRTALQLAEDLRREQAGEPIQARPTGLAEKGAKWVKRRPAVASLLGAIVAGTAAALLLLTLAWQNADAAQGRAETEERNAKVALSKEAEQRRLAEEAQRQKEAALKNEEKLRYEAEQQRRSFQRLSVGLLLDRGVALAEHDDTARGLLWMTQGLKVAGKDAPDLEQAIRRNLASWGATVHPLALTISPYFPQHVAWSPDGKTLLTSGSAVQRWNALTGKLIDQLPASSGKAVYSPDGMKIVTIFRVTQLWDAKTGKPLGKPLPHPQFVENAVFSPNSKFLATVCVDQAVRLWDVAAGKPIGDPLPQKSNSQAITAAFSPDSKKLLTAAHQDGKVWLWDVKGQPLGKPIEEHGLTCAAFSPDGKWIATGTGHAGQPSSGGIARVWDAATGEAVGRPLPHNGPVTCLAVAGDLLLTGSADRMARIWKVSSGKLWLAIMPHGGSVLKVAFSPKNTRFLTVAADQTVRVWEGTSLVGGAIHHQDGILEAAFSPDGKRIATLCRSRIVRVWTPTAVTTDLVATPGLQTLSPDGKLFATFPYDYKTKVAKGLVWAAAPGKPPMLVSKLFDKKIADIPTQGVNSAAFSHDGKTLVTTSHSGTIHRWDAATGKERWKNATNANNDSWRLRADDRSVLITSTATATLLDAATGKLRYRLKHPPAPVPCGALSPDGSLAVTGAADGVVRFWDTATGQALERTLAHRGAVLALAFSADGKYLLSGSADRTARLWDVATGQPASVPLAHASPVTVVAVSPDGKTLVTSCTNLDNEDARVQLWDTATGKPLGLPAALPYVRGIGFEQDGKTFLVAGLLNLLRGKVPQPMQGDADRLRLWVTVLAGLELDEDGTIGALDGRMWEERRKRLENLGGPPVP